MFENGIATVWKSSALYDLLWEATSQRILVASLGMI